MPPDLVIVGGKVPAVRWSGRVVAGKLLERPDEPRRPCAGPDCVTMVPRDRLLCHFCRRSLRLAA